MVSKYLMGKASGVSCTSLDILRSKLLPGRRLNRCDDDEKMVTIILMRVVFQVTGEERPGVGHQLPYCQAVVQVSN